MKKKLRMNRRRFLQASATATAATTAACSSRNQSSWRFLSDREAETLEAICEQIIPTDQDPGAAWAWTVRYIDRQLAGFYRQHQETYRMGIAETDRRAGGIFARTIPGKQLEILQEMERDEKTKAFFSLVVNHTMQGFYGNPRHGGNRNYCSWRMLGVPSSPVRGRDMYDLTRGERS